ncbi:uncharacterized protein BYT42DRAFT_612504 [Radiomyces spectabilis]|uniref:uncharacterized protein n=1 Tax=Radiomyces spectabilis TaxID=64574 RepID=UPI0022200C63|nr:uncharacterized protein BYT42DRAFT_612504 [Radiomyces spectabilis]KAI8384834.1 hypothetical protein BYT42DRAFT_612504 [Radiomyces spectabilis]
MVSRDSSEVAALKQRVAVLKRLVAEGDHPKKRSSVTIDHADYKLRRLIRKHYEADFADNPDLLRLE